MSSIKNNNNKDFSGHPNRPTADDEPLVGPWDQSRAAARSASVDANAAGDNEEYCPPVEETPKPFRNESSFYDILEVSPKATQKEIKAQFLKLSLKYHPDKETGDPEKFKSLMQAYKVLSSKKRRKTYDESLSNTWEELCDRVKRDVEYHETEMHTRVDEEGNRVFDEKSFHAAFEKERNDADAGEIREMLEELEQSGRGAQQDLPEQLDAWEALKANRAAEEEQRREHVNTMEGDTLHALRSDFNPNIFNQMFNDMKAKKKELVDYDMRNEDEFLQNFDQQDLGMWQGDGGWGGSMFGAHAGGSSMGGLEALGGLRAQDGGDDELLNEFGNRQYENRPEVTFTRDLPEEDRKAQMDEYSRRIEEIQAERQRLNTLKPDEFQIRESVISQALGDPSLFDDTIPGLDPGTGRVAINVDDSAADDAGCDAGDMED